MILDRILSGSRGVVVLLIGLLVYVSDVVCRMIVHADLNWSVLLRTDVLSAVLNLRCVGNDLNVEYLCHDDLCVRDVTR